MIEKSEILEAISLVESKGIEHNTDYFSKNRDIFQARIDTFTQRTQAYLEAAIIAELGNNTFDHNFIFNENYSRGCFFNFENNKVILADFGQGIKNSLKVLYNVESDIQALKLAFSEHVTSRAKENRGNGLKFVSENIIQNNWNLYFQSGTGFCNIDKDGIKYSESEIDIIGCLIIFKY